MAHSYTVHLALGALLIWCTMCGYRLQGRHRRAHGQAAPHGAAQGRTWCTPTPCTSHPPTAECMHHVWHRHLTPPLAALAAQALHPSVSSVTEVGVRQGYATWAFLEAARRRLSTLAYLRVHCFDNHNTHTHTSSAPPNPAGGTSSPARALRPSPSGCTTSPCSRAPASWSN